MILYHGSNQPVINPDIEHSRRYCDFGKGFYLSKSKDQAINRSKRNKGTKNYVTTYIMNMNIVENNFKIKVFKTYDEEWFDFIKMCRNTPFYMGNYDLIMGPTADGNVIEILAAEELGEITKLEAIIKLKFYKPYYQVCIKNTEILTKYLRLRDYTEV